MKAISLWQPWASLMVHGLKRVETRSWAIQYRGPLFIHAARKWNGTLAELCLKSPFRANLERFGLPPEKHNWTMKDIERRKNGWDMPFGAIIGCVEVHDCVRTDRIKVTDEGRGSDAPIAGPIVVQINDTEHAFGDFTVGRFGWLCKNPIAIAEPVRCKGRQGLFDVPDDVVLKLLEAVTP